MAKHLRPTLHLAVVNPLLPRSRWKDKAEQAIKAADLVIINPYAIVPDDRAVGSNDDIQDVLDRVSEKSLRGSMAPLRRWEDQRLFEAIVRILRK